MTNPKTTAPNQHNAPANASNNPYEVNMEEYRETVPLWKRVWQHSLTQMILLSIQSFCGPAMSDAITGASYTKSAIVCRYV